MSNITPEMRWQVWERDDFRCQHCQRRKHLSIDHIVASVNGGTDDLENLQTLCRACNSRKNRLDDRVPDWGSLERMERELPEAVAEYVEAVQERNDRIREARAAGMTLRHIASIVGLSVETIRKITMKEGT